MKDIKAICCTAIGFILGGLTIVGANQAIQAIQNTEIKITLNNQLQEFKDETTGEIEYPITYNNRTYLPLRSLANLLGVMVDYDSKSKTASLTSNDNMVYSNQDLLVQEKIRYTLSKELEEKRPDYYNDNYFDLVAKADINNDGKSEYILIIAPHDNEFNMRIFSSDGEELVKGLEELDQLVECVEVRKSNDSYVLFVETLFGEGICYENSNIYEVKLSDKQFETKLLARYVCDQDEEERKRALIIHEDGSPATIEEQISTHTLKYIVDDKIVSENEYQKVIEDYKKTHGLVTKIK